jgi:hypothetical protein
MELIFLPRSQRTVFNYLKEKFAIYFSEISINIAFATNHKFLHFNRHGSNEGNADFLEGFNAENLELIYSMPQPII